MQEWDDKYNSFNSYKVFKHIERWEPIIKENKIDPPLFISIDPSGGCNLNCDWCNALESINKNKNQKLSIEQIDNIIKLLTQWKTKAVCVAGGGEPLLNENTSYLINKLINNNIKVGLITNGTLLHLYYKELMGCEWIGISIDAGNRNTFNQLKKVKPEMFDKILENIKLLSSYRNENYLKSPQITYKYLIHPENYKDLYQAIQNAKEIGCDVFHARPGGDPWFNSKGFKFSFTSEMINHANALIDEGRNKFENDHFKVFGIVHKFTDNWSIKHSFKKCYAVATNCFISPSGIIGLCCDRRGDETLDLCTVDEQLNNSLTGWGSEKHKHLIKKIDLSKCPRCTYTHINELFENVIINDKMGCDFI